MTKAELLAQFNVVYDIFVESDGDSPIEQTLRDELLGLRNMLEEMEDE